MAHTPLPEPVRHDAAAGPEPPRSPLRLAVSRGALGLELYEPVVLGPLQVEALMVALPGIRFPVDLSGGVALFRNRRGALQRVRCVARLADLEELAGQQLRELLDAQAAVRIWPISGGCGLGLAAGRQALAFDLLWAPVGGELRILVTRARGVGLAAPPLALALRALDSLLSGLGERRGRVYRVEALGGALCRSLLPTLGCRAPATGGVAIGELEAGGDELAFELDSELVTLALGQRTARELELARLVTTGDDALAAGDVATARADYLEALEAAPRHPELSLLVAELDVLAGGREEAALALLVESQQATRAGAIGARLLAAVGDLPGAREAVADAARDEPYPPLAALAWCQLAALEESASARLAALDRAVAAAPSQEQPRWQRLRERVRVGDVDGAVADAEHLEGAAAGRAARFAAARGAATALLEAGFVRDAGRVFERALRYVPDDVQATAGLGRALREAHQPERAFALLERAAGLARQRGERVPGQLLVDLAQLLAEHHRDLPQAIARVREVTGDSAAVVQARALEGRWRNALGDLAGASLAYGRLRETIEARTDVPARAARWLVEAAGFERTVQRDLFAAERHLAAALRLAPRDPHIAGAFREVAALVADQLQRRRARPLPSPEATAGSEAGEAPWNLDGSRGVVGEPPATGETEVGEAAPDTDGSVGVVPGPATGETEVGEAAPDTDGSGSIVDEAAHAPSEGAWPSARPDLEDELDAEVEVEALLPQVQGDASRWEPFARLARLLDGLERDAELFALLSGRLEDAEGEERQRLVALARPVLARLVTRARTRGESLEADLYGAFLDGL